LTRINRAGLRTREAIADIRQG